MKDNCSGRLDGLQENKRKNVHFAIHLSNIASFLCIFYEIFYDATAQKRKDCIAKTAWIDYNSVVLVIFIGSI